MAPTLLPGTDKKDYYYYSRVTGRGFEPLKVYQIFLVNPPQYLFWR